MENIKRIRLFGIILGYEHQMRIRAYMLENQFNLPNEEICQSTYDMMEMMTKHYYLGYIDYQKQEIGLFFKEIRCVFNKDLRESWVEMGKKIVNNYGDIQNGRQKKKMKRDREENIEDNDEGAGSEGSLSQGESDGGQMDTGITFPGRAVVDSIKARKTRAANNKTFEDAESDNESLAPSDGLFQVRKGQVNITEVKTFVYYFTFSPTLEMLDMRMKWFLLQ